MKTKLLFSALLLLLLPLNAFAQMDERKPGIYSVVDGKSTPLLYTFSTNIKMGMSIGPVGFGDTKCCYKGVTSGVNASDTLVLVINPKLVAGVMAPTMYTNFYPNMTPEDMLILPLIVNNKKQRREYDSGLALCVYIGPIVMGGTANDATHPTFKWERISDNSFMINTTGLGPGEYGVIFRPHKLQSHEYGYLFGFTIPEPAEEPTVQPTEEPIEQPTVQPTVQQ